MAEQKNDTPVPAERGTKSKDAPTPSGGVHDRVVMASRFADGVTPAQQGDWEFIGPKDAVRAGARHQHVSAALAELDPATDEDEVPSLEDRKAAIKPARERADAEVEERHRGLGDVETADDEV